MKYFYGMRLRGFSPGCQPMEGYLEKYDSDDSAFHDIIAYEKPLTEDEEKHYSLTPLWACEQTDNLGNDSMTFYKSHEDRYKFINGILQFAYDEYCATYPDENVTWDNRYLLFEDTSEVYVPGSDCYTRCKEYDPIQRIKDYIANNRCHPIQKGNIYFCLREVNGHEDSDIGDIFPYSNCDDEQLSFWERYNRGLDELEKLTRGMTLEQAQDYFEKETTGDNANFYGSYVYVFTKKRNPKCIFYGVRMD